MLIIEKYLVKIMKKKPSSSLIVLNSGLITKVISELGNENFTFIMNLIE